VIQSAYGGVQDHVAIAAAIEMALDLVFNRRGEPTF
jgi:hypothetical protein